MDATRLETICRGFSCPQESFDRQTLELIAVGHARELTSRFVERYGRQLDKQGDGLAGLLRVSTRNANGFEVVWDPAFGQIRQVLLQHRQADFPRHAAALALRLHECGMAGQWTLRLNAPARLRMGPWLLPVADHLVVQAGKNRISVQSRLKGTASTTTFSQRGASWTTPAAQELPHIAADKARFILLFPDALEGIALEKFGRVAPGRRRGTIVPAVETAIALLRRHAPIYLSWVDRVVRHVVPLDTSGARMQSGSDAGQPGVVQMSVRGPAIGLAEMLVHEGTHLYMSLLCQLGKLDDGSDPTLYYSPVRKTGRPIRWILVAYHAFANVLLLHRTCMANGFDDTHQYCRRNEEVLVPQLRQLEAALRSSPALTSLGHALWKPLATRIG